MGHRIEELLPNREERERLFRELDDYVRVVMDHMIEHFLFSYEEYITVREEMKPFEKNK